MKIRRVLVVEDDADIRDVLAEDLASRGYAVETAENGVDALNAMRSSASAPELVVFDLFMPVMDGWQLLDEMSADEALQRLRVIVTTGADRPGCFPAHVRVLRKPYSVDALVQEIERTPQNV